MSADPAKVTAPLRPRLSLDGDWEFEFEGRTARLAGEGRRIRSPGVWQTQFPELRNAPGLGRYRRRIEAPAEWRGKRIVLVMEGVFHETVIRADEAPVASHGDGWTAIEADLTEAIAGKARFTLGVDASAPDDFAFARFSETLAGKQDWYGLQGGIWKPAWIEARNQTHIRALAVQAFYDLVDGAVAIRGSASGGANNLSLRLNVSREGVAAARSEHALSSGDFDLELRVPAPKPWSPDDPNLYELVVELMRDGEVLDALRRPIGFRRFEARDGRLMLNGKSFMLFGALDQDWHPEEECRAPSPEFLEERFKNAKAMGLNALRCHVKIPDRLYFDLANRLGLIVWLDMPYMQFLTPHAREGLMGVFRATVAAHGHHACICIWTLFNEGWGIDLDDNPDDRRFLVHAFDEAKARVPNALLVDNSPCFPRNYHLKTEIEDFHWYSGFPQQNAAFAATTRAFAKRADWAFSPHGDAVRRGDEPLVCSEFGVWGLPHPRDIREADGSEPWWFESGHDWNSSAAYPHGIETRFRDAGLAPIFGDLDGFVGAAQEMQYRALKFQIEALRNEAGISGYVITELNDVQWEANGLLDALNHPRAFAGRLANLQREWLIIARAPRTAIREGEAVEARVRLAGAGAVPAGSRVSWRFSGREGSAAIGAAPIDIRIEAGASGRIAIAPLKLEARDSDGRLLSANELEFCVVPPLAAAQAPRLWPMDEGAARLLRAIGWPRLAETPEAAEAHLATRLTTPAREALIAGRKVLLIANSNDALIDPARKLPLNDRHNFPGMLLRARDGTPWDGQWMGAFAWRRTDGPWSALPNGPMLDEHFTELMPKYVLTGFPSTSFAGLVDAGVAVGWLHLAAAFSKRSFLGKAWLTVSTFDLTSEAAAKNPLAPHLLAALAAS